MAPAKYLNGELQGAKKQGLSKSENSILKQKPKEVVLMQKPSFRGFLSIS